MPKRIDNIEPNGHDHGEGGSGRQRPQVAATGSAARAHPAETGAHGGGGPGGAAAGVGRAAQPHTTSHPSTAGMTPAGAAAAEYVWDHANFPQQARIHHIAPSLLWTTFFILVGLLILTVILYYVDLSKAIPIPGINLIVALMVATVKAGFVVWNFMNVRNSTRLTWLYVGLGFVWLSVLAGIFLDYQSRAWLNPPGWE